MDPWELFRLLVAVSSHFVRTHLLKLCALSYITGVWEIVFTYVQTNKTRVGRYTGKQGSRKWILRVARVQTRVLDTDTDCL